MTPAFLVLALAATAPAARAPATTTAPAATPAAGDPALPRKEVAPLVKSVFDGGFPFCSDAKYPLTKDELKWCALLSKEDPRCPALERACTRGATADLVGQRGHQSTLTFSLPASPLPVRVLLWGVLGAAVAVIIYNIAKQALGQRAPGRDQPVEVAVAAAEDPAAEIARQVETDVQRLLDRARAAAATGDFAAAVDDAYAALLRKLEGAGLVTVEAHRTNGDHVRDVSRQRPALRPRMQAVVGRVEEVQFGGGSATESRFRDVMTDVVGLLGERLAGWLPVAVKLALALGLAGSLAACSLDRDRWERSPSGRAGVVDLLERYGFTPRERLATLAKIDGAVSSLVLLPAADVDEAGWNAIASWVGDGGTLVVAGGLRPLPAWIGATVVGSDSSSSAAPISAPITVPAEQRERLPRLTAVVPDVRQVKLATPDNKAGSAYGDEGEEPPSPLLVRGHALYAVERTFDDGGRAIVLADDRLFTNASLLVADNARLLVELLRPGGAKVELAGELTGLVSQNPITSVRRGRLAPAMLQLTLLLLLFFVYKGAHFGRPIDPAAGSRRAFAEHARAIGMMYGRRRAGRHALESYGSFALERMRERLNLTGGKGLLAVAEELATRTGRPLGEVMRLLVESRPPASRPTDLERDAALQKANAANDLATLRDLARLLEHGTLGGSQPPR